MFSADQTIGQRSELSDARRSDHLRSSCRLFAGWRKRYAGQATTDRCDRLCDTLVQERGDGDMFSAIREVPQQSDRFPH
ncbi:hypothetical protein [Mycobacterium simiae]|uniref:hypothetical protein n=1 Tax=Mycobacterium simiae TaxID=1784 RepID=UPI002639B58B|nr:hypothetical protein [Mycobacterium simiae]